MQINLCEKFSSDRSTGGGPTGDRRQRLLFLLACPRSSTLLRKVRRRFRIYVKRPWEVVGDRWGKGGTSVLSAGRTFPNGCKSAHCKVVKFCEVIFFAISLFYGIFVSADRVLPLFKRFSGHVCKGCFRGFQGSRFCSVPSLCLCFAMSGG